MQSQGSKGNTILKDKRDMPKTIKLYDDEPYEREFAGKVMEVREAGNGLADVLLDRTLFFPEEGGQSPDKGKLCGYTVSNVSIEDGIITHRVMCSMTDIKAGDEVHGVIDWEHRFSNMQNHTGEHILSGLLHSIWGSENTGFHLSDNIVTLDTSKELESSDLEELERRANEVVYRNIKTECRYYDPEELKDMTYRSKLELKEDVRLAVIPGVDVCACCAPHVASTGEIGIIKIIKAIRYKGGMRLTILSGKRAYDHLAYLQTVTDDLSHMLSESPDRLRDAVGRLLKENEDCRIRIKNEAGKRLEEEIKSLPEDLKDAVLFTESADKSVQRNAVNTLAEKHMGICAVFSSDDADGYNFILSFPQGDARDVSNLLKERLAAKGGGSKEMVQGNVRASKEEILEVLKLSRME